ncbi:MAG: ABC-F family ATP-binding cassette domain-containing protein [Melioribacteraceae bacterium]|nr:MAG: ABC-F family ATP-binding cassette domain-containing protein [Melioribacteraceae bacterium]
MSRVILKNISYKIPNGTKIFDELSFSFNPELTGLVGQNGIGKSTLAKIIEKEMIPESGNVEVFGKVKYLPQNFSELSGKTVADVFLIKEKYDALKRLEEGIGNKNDLLILDDDWELENRIDIVKEKMNISHIDLSRKYDSLSGGEKVKCLFASLLLSNPDFIILDEPTNHLDYEGREIVYDFVRNWKKGMIVISHDRSLLRLMNTIVELTSFGLKSYGGNYDFYFDQKELEDQAFKSQLRNVTSEFKKAIKQKEEIIQRQLKRNISGEKKAIKSNMPKILANQLKGSGEKTLKKLNDIHNEKINDIEGKLSEVKSKQRSNYNIKFDLEQNAKQKHSNLVTAEVINFSYDDSKTLWKENMSFTIYGGERIVLKGKNGSGKTTLLKIIRGELNSSIGQLSIRTNKIGSLDQDASILNDELTLLENIKNASQGKLPEYELRIRLGRFLFYKDDVFKKVNVLSGGEKMRAGLACLLSFYNIPDLIILDEPTNNLDLESIQELTNGLNQFNGAIIVVSHDKDFLSDIGIERTINLDEYL